MVEKGKCFAFFVRLSPSELNKMVSTDYFTERSCLCQSTTFSSPVERISESRRFAVEVTFRSRRFPIIANLYINLT